MDIVYLNQLEVDTVIGIYAWERQIRQTLFIDLEMGFDNRKPAATDAIEDTLDYKAVARRVTAFTQASEFQLVETLAERLAELLREEFALPWVRIRINKRGALRQARDVGVIIERGQR